LHIEVMLEAQLCGSAGGIKAGEMRGGPGLCARGNSAADTGGNQSQQAGQHAAAAAP
jgi:hypothetical protein